MKQYLNVVRIGANLGVTTIETDTKLITREKIHYEPTLYVRSNNPESNFKTVYGDKVEPKQLESMSAATKYIKDCKDIRVPVYGIEKYPVAYVAETFTSDYDMDAIRIFCVDIENKMRDEHGNRILKPNPYEAKGELTVVTIHDSFTDTYYVFGNKVEWDNSEGPKISGNYESIYCENEKELCVQLVQFWRMNYPDIITGWHTDGYDIPYLINRITQVLGENAVKKLSPWGVIREREHHDNFGNDIIEYNIVGVASLDYIEVYKKNTFSGRESYSLEYIANYETGLGKIDYRELGYTDLDDLWERNPQLYCTYNVRDVEAVNDIDEKNKFISIMVSVAYYAGVNFDDVFSGMRVWDAVIHKFLIDKNIVTSPNQHADKDLLPGAYVKQCKPGLYKNLMSYDLNSLYPSIIRTLNIGVETVSAKTFPDNNISHRDMVTDLVAKDIDTDFLKDENLTLAANGVVFDNTHQSFLSELMEMLYNKRRLDKDEMLRYMSLSEADKKANRDFSHNDSEAVKFKNSQMVVKILLNSLYGCLGNVHFRYYDNRMASAITLTGQAIIKWSERKVNEYLNNILNTDEDYVVLIDTDSIVVTFDTLVNKVFKEYDVAKVTDFLDKVGQEKIEPFLENIYDELAEYLNSRDNQMVMKRENIASSGLFVAKKRYAMKVQDSEGVRYDYANPHVKVMGLEIVKSSTAKVVQGEIKSCLTALLDLCTADELRHQIDGIRTKFFKMSPEDLAFPRGVNNLDKYSSEVSIYIKRTPINVRAALLANWHFNANIVGGTKIKYIPLKVPNPINENVIGWTDKIDPSLEKYVDYKTLYDKSFYEPVKTLALAAGYDLTVSNTLF